MQDDARQRWDMVSHQIFTRGVRDERVLSAMRLIPRHEFLPQHLRPLAYADQPVPIAEGVTLPQPYVVAYMIEALGLKGGEKVLEIGAGTGYAAAVLARTASRPKPPPAGWPTLTCKTCIFAMTPAPKAGWKRPPLTRYW